MTTSDCRTRCLLTAPPSLDVWQVGFGMCGHPKVSWWLLLVVLAFGLGATALLLLASQFVPTWNCIIMRDQEVVEQPMAMETVPQRLLEEAQGFIERWGRQGYTKKRPLVAVLACGKLELSCICFVAIVL